MQKVVLKVQVCDATMLHSYSKAGDQKITLFITTAINYAEELT